MTLRTRVVATDGYSQMPVRLTAEGTARAVTDWVAKGWHVTYTEGKTYRAVATKKKEVTK